MVGQTCLPNLSLTSPPPPLDRCQAPRRDLLGPSRAILGPSWAILGHFGANLAPSWGQDGPQQPKYQFPLGCLMILGPILTPSWGLLGPSWGHLGAILGPSWAILGPRGHLGASWAILESRYTGKPKYVFCQFVFKCAGAHPGAIFGANLGPRGAILGPLGAILGPSWDLLAPLGAILGSAWRHLGRLKSEIMEVAKTYKHLRF